MQGRRGHALHGCCHKDKEDPDRQRAGATLLCFSAFSPPLLDHSRLYTQVYSAALYVEGNKCSKELGLRSRGGFFETDEDFCTGLLDGAFQKVLVIRLLRDVDGQTFADALNESLVPRMTLSGHLFLN